MFLSDNEGISKKGGWEGPGWSEIVSRVDFYVSQIFVFHILQCFLILKSSVRLSLNNCMISVEFVQLSSLSMSSSAIASSKAAFANLQAQSVIKFHSRIQKN